MRNPSQKEYESWQYTLGWRTWAYNNEAEQERKVQLGKKLVQIEHSAWSAPFIRKLVGITPKEALAFKRQFQSHDFSIVANRLMAIKTLEKPIITGQLMIIYIKPTLAMKDKIQFDFSTKMWQHSTPGGWYFVSLPKAIAKEIRANLQWQEEGWGRMKAIAQIGILSWETAIWFDTKMDTYILPIKAAIRKQAKLEVDKVITLSIWV